MPIRKEIPIVGPTYQSSSLDVSAQVTENMYPEVQIPNGKKPIAMTGFPGLTLLGTVGSGLDRGMAVMNGVLYKVTGGNLYSVSTSWAGTDLGAIVGTGRVIMDTNGTQLIICTGTTAYSYTTAGGLVTISDASIVNPNSIRFINRRGLYDSDGNGSVLAASTYVATALDDLTTSESSAFAESRPDALSRIYTFAQNIYMMGTETIEPFWNSGSGSPPFDRINSAMQKLGVIGLGAIHAVDSNRDFVYFLGNDRLPYQMASFNRQNIASPGLINEWDSYKDATDCYITCIEIDAQPMAVFSFPTAGKTWAYHEQTGFWFNLSTSTNRDRHPISSYQDLRQVGGYGKKIITDYRNGNIYALDKSVYTNNGEVIKRVRHTAPITSESLGLAEGKKISISKLTLVAETGSVTLSAGSAPNIGIRVSTDAGRTFTELNPQSMGKLGEYKTKMLWPGPVVANEYEAIFEIYATDPVKFSLAAMYGDVSVGTN